MSPRRWRIPYWTYRKVRDCEITTRTRMRRGVDITDSHPPGHQGALCNVEPRIRAKGKKQRAHLCVSDYAYQTKETLDRDQKKKRWTRRCHRTIQVDPSQPAGSGAVSVPWNCGTVPVRADPSLFQLSFRFSFWGCYCTLLSEERNGHEEGCQENEEHAPFFWSVFIGSLVPRMRKMIFLAWFWPVTPQLPCPFSTCESCDERDHWALWNLVHSYYNIRAGSLDDPSLEGLIPCLVSAKRAICAKNGDLPFLWSVNHYANVYLHQRKTVKRDTADGKMDETLLVFDY